MHQENDEERVKTREMVTKMTQIYKSMEKQYNEKIDKHEEEVKDQEQTKKALKEEIS